MTNGKNNVEKSSLEVQLSEVNKRSQLYLSQFWQVPLAYLAATLIAVSQIKNNTGERADIFILLSSIIAGIFVFIHIILMAIWNRKATNNIRALEKKLKFESVSDFNLAELAGPGYWSPLILLVISTILIYIYLLYKMICPLS